MADNSVGSTELTPRRLPRLALLALKVGGAITFLGTLAGLGSFYLDATDDSAQMFTAAQEATTSAIEHQTENQLRERALRGDRMDGECPWGVVVEVDHGLRAKNCTPGTEAIENSDLSGSKLDNVHAPDVEISNSTLGDFAVDSSNLDGMLISGATDATNATFTRTSLRGAHLLDLRFGGRPGAFAYNRVSGAGLPADISMEDLATLEFEPDRPPCLRAADYDLDAVLGLANFADTIKAEIAQTCTAYPSV